MNMARAPLMMRGERSCECHFCSAPMAVVAWVACKSDVCFALEGAWLDDPMARADGVIICELGGPVLDLTRAPLVIGGTAVAISASDVRWTRGCTCPWELVAISAGDVRWTGGCRCPSWELVLVPLETGDGREAVLYVPWRACHDLRW